MDLLLALPPVPGCLDEVLGAGAAAASVTSRGGCPPGCLTTFSAFARGTDAAAAPGTVATALAMAVPVPGRARAQRRAPNTPNAIPLKSTHTQVKVGALAGTAASESGADAVGEVAVRAGSAAGWARAHCPAPLISTTTSPHRPTGLASRLRIVQHLG